jgi:GR25 family glycosyltransferase involved in LPS biosynthesis
MTINEFVDEIYFINLERRRDRLLHIEKELSKYDIKATRFEAIDAYQLGLTGKKSEIGAIGALRSHKGVIKKALKKKQNRICVLEDDIIICEDFKERFEIYSQNVPSDWDIMYLGCHFHGCRDPKHVGNRIYKVFECYGCFAMILNNKNNLFERILEITEKESKPIDNYLRDEIHTDYKFNFYVFKPFFVKTLDTVSDIADRDDSFTYDAVDMHFSDIYTKPPAPIKENIIMPPQPEPLKKDPNEIAFEIRMLNPQKYMCEDYLRSPAPFVILIGNKTIYDSDNIDRINLCFNKDHFTLYGRAFPYTGMVIKRK